MKSNVAIIAWTVEIVGFALVVTAAWLLWEYARRRSTERGRKKPAGDDRP